MALGPYNKKPVEKIKGCFQDKRKRKLSDPHKIRYQAHGVDASKADKSQSISWLVHCFRLANIVFVIVFELNGDQI